MAVIANQTMCYNTYVSSNVSIDLKFESSETPGRIDKATDSVVR